ncbi:polysaccharide biosynthesis/export family protein [Sphingomonas sp. SM33]|uniref:Polysaccharide biosynthesis/export family protein n=1 Tax=Sphingomonas telluris TaxID=2907998 RepID=A0ABS9VI81_9SPHN|nr:polysaccharide biosynthesis/export family protein [Sphingomonas telluris]
MRKVLISILSILLISLSLAQPAGAQTRPPVPQARAAVAVPGPAYRINPGDELEILVWGDERLQRSVRVLPDGTFAFPLIGQVVAAGQLPADLERVISAALQPQYRGPVPQITVSVKNPSGYQFSVVGKVKAPGTYTPGRYVNALEALSIAGGPSEFASINGAKILRKNGQQIQTIRLRLGDALKGDSTALSENDVPFIQSGDTLVVP